MGQDDSYYASRAALVTGGGSGIGRALGRRLYQLGAHVTLGDIDGAAERAATELAAEQPASAGSVSGVELDVRDRNGFARRVEQMRERHGRIDLLFNNAGISIGGPTDLLLGEYWDRIIDVNLGGVVNGILAAYPAMVSQGSGHIVNTASAAGLVAAPFAAPYSTTKFAVVGLGNALRPEAACHGVRVSTLCPGMVETPILDKGVPSDLPQRTTATMSGRTYLRTLRQSPISADALARRALDAVADNKGIIIIPRRVAVGWYISRLSPRAIERVGDVIVRRVQAQMESADAKPSELA